MTPQDQEFIYIPNEQYGDCQRACIASLLDLPISEVPHFLRESEGKAAVFWRSIIDFVEARGFEYLCSLPKFMPEHAEAMGGYHIIAGPSPRGMGIFHAVVGLNGEIVFDPHPSKAGLAGDPSEWTYDYLVKE